MNEYLVLTQIIPFYRKNLGITLKDIASLSLTSKSINDDLYLYINREIDKLPVMITLAFRTIENGNVELSFALFDVGSEREPQSPPGDHVVSFKIDSKKRNYPEFSTIYWVSRWKNTAYSPDLNQFLDFWTPLISELTLSNIEREGRFLSQHCSIYNVKIFNSKYGRLRINWEEIKDSTRPYKTLEWKEKVLNDKLKTITISNDFISHFLDIESAEYLNSS